MGKFECSKDEWGNGEERGFSLLADDFDEDFKGRLPSEFGRKKICSQGPKSSLPLVMATTTSRPMIWRFMWASALSSPVLLCWYWEVGAMRGEFFEPGFAKSSCRPD